VKRRTGWEKGPHTGTGPDFFQPLNVSSNTAVTAIGSRFEMDGLTITRIRGRFTAFLAQTESQGSAMLAMGICVVDERAFNVGTGALPDPLYDADDEMWLWHQYLPFQSCCGNVIFGNQGTNAWHGEIDFRAQRKVNIGDVLVLIFSNAGFFGNQVVRIHAVFRMLLKLP
jgi:hypothetical protein